MPLGDDGKRKLTVFSFGGRSHHPTHEVESPDKNLQFPIGSLLTLRNICILCERTHHVNQIYDNLHEKNPQWTLC